MGRQIRKSKGKTMKPNFLKLIVVIYRIMIKRKKRIHTNTLQKVSVKY